MSRLLAMCVSYIGSIDYRITTSGCTMLINPEVTSKGVLTNQATNTL